MRNQKLHHFKSNDRNDGGRSLSNILINKSFEGGSNESKGNVTDIGRKSLSLINTGETGKITREIANISTGQNTREISKISKYGENVGGDDYSATNENLKRSFRRLNLKPIVQHEE
jgi:hypothetical protein